MGYFRGFAVTFRKMFERRVTTSYPQQKRDKPARLHGRHVLNRYEDGMEKCIGCELCAGFATALPKANSKSLNPAANTRPTRVGA